jgi:YbbR domain-containing protein
MKKILLNNLSLKLLAIVIACITWFAVMYNLNPMDTKTLMVPVKIINGEVLTAQNRVYDVIGDLEVEVEAHSFDLTRISESDFNLYVDMRYPLGGTTSPVRYQISREIVGNADLIEKYTLKTEYLDFEVEEIITREFPVDVIVSGSVAENYTTMDKATSVPESITVTGRSSEVERIKKVVYYLDIKDASEEINESGKPKLLDYDDNELTDLSSVTISPETVKVVQPIAQTKSVVISCNAVTGEPATGYGLAEVVLDVTSVKVAGYKAVLADIVSINIPAEMINVEGLTANKTFSIDLAELELPEGVSLVGSNNIVNVTAKIEKKKQNNFRLQLPDDVSLEKKNDLYDYTFTDTVAFLTVEGISNDLDNMDVTNIVATLDVSDYEEGVYSIPLSVKLPEGITLVGSPEVEVQITPHETEPEATAPPATAPQPAPPTPTEPETTTPAAESETETTGQNKPVDVPVETTTPAETTTVPATEAPTTTTEETSEDKPEGNDKNDTGAEEAEQPA